MARMTIHELHQPDDESPAHIPTAGLDEALDQLANQEPSDKTWVLRILRRIEKLTRDARLLPGQGSDGSLR